MLTHIKTILFSLMALIFWQNNANAQCTSVDFTANTTTGCAPLAVTLVAKNVPAGARIEWNLGGGFVTGKDTAFKFFTASGKVDISLRITESGKTTPCTTVVKANYIEVLPKPKIKLYRSDTLLCNGAGTVTLIDSTPSVSSRTWFFDGTQQSTTGTTLTKSVSLGAHSINLIVKNSFGCESVYKNNTGVDVYSTINVEICGNITQTNNETVGNFTGNVLNSSLKPVSYAWSFPGASPNSSTSSNPKNITYSAPVSASAVTMDMKFPGGCVYTFSKSDFIEPFLSVDDDSACVKQEIQVSNLAADGGRSDFSMNFPGANFVSGDVKKDFKISYVSTGAKTIEYAYKYNSNTNACQTSVRAPNIVVIEGPLARAFSNDKTDCTLDSVLMESNSIVPSTGTNLYSWRVYNKNNKAIPPAPVGPSKNLSKFTMKFPAKGVYSLTLTVENTKNGCVDSIVLKNYLRLIPPDARIKFSDSVLCADDQLVMESKSFPPPTSGNPYTYSWLVQHVDSSKIKFDAATQKFTRRLRVPGKYTIRLIVKSNTTCADTLLLTEYVEVQGILASMKVDDKSGCPPLTTDVSSKIDLLYPPSASPQYWYAWDVFPKKKKTTVLASIADSTLDKTSITFSSTACYTVSLAINDIYGCKKNLSSGSICVGTKANFGWDTDTLSQLCLNEPFQLVDSSIINPFFYQWSVDKPGLVFSDSTISQPKITFKKAGKYNIKLVVQTNTPSACKDSITREIEIIAPEAKFKIDKPITTCAPQQITFVNESVNANSYKWIYGDGGTSLNSNASHVYIFTKNNILGFTSKLIAFQTGSEECADTFELSSKVRIIGPEPLFKPDTLLGCDTQVVTYSNLTSPINASYKFDYGDGSVPDVDKMRPHQYVFNGTAGQDSVMYFPTIVATSFGCDAYYTDTIVVYRSPKALFIADTLEGCRPLTVTLVNKSSSAQRFYWDLWNDNTKDSFNQDTVVLKMDTVGQFGMSITAKIGSCISSYVLDSIIKVSVAPEAKFTISATQACDTLTAFFTNTSSPISSDFIIDYGDGSKPDTNKIGSHFYSIPATHPDDSIIYYPTLTANNFGCDNVYQLQVVIYRSAVADFTIDTTIGCQPLEVVLINKSATNFGFEWDFYNDGVVELANKDTLRLTLDTSGYFSAALITTYKGGCTFKKLVDSLVFVVDLPKPSFTMSQTEGCDSVAIEFKNTGNPSFTNYTFDFGDGSAIENDTIPNHTYYFPATALGDSILFIPKISGTRVLCDASFSDTVVVYKSPIASFSIDTSFGCQPTTFTLLNTSTKVNFLEWDIFNDKTIEKTGSDTLKFTSDSIGIWPVRLFTRYIGGCTSEITLDSVFQVFRMPKPVISYSKIRGCDSFEVAFTTTNPLDSFIINYGNGLSDTNTTKNIRYYFPTILPKDSGTYIINYEVYNPLLASCVALEVDTLQIFRSPTAGFSSDFLSGCAPLSITFSDTSNRAVRYAWDFNDDAIIDDTTKSPSTVLDNGKQTIGLVITSAEGCRDTLYKKNYITVFEPPRVSISASKTVSCPNSPIQFNDNSVLDTLVDKRNWSFGIPVTGDTLVVPNPQVAYNKLGFFMVHLTVVDSNKCANTDSLEIEIINLDTPEVVNFKRLSYSMAAGSQLEWQNSKEADFLFYELIKVTKIDSSKNPLTATTYGDADTDFGDLARYYLQVTDSCNNKSLVSEGISKLIIKGDNELENVLRVEWRYLQPNNFKTFRIYRRYPSGNKWTKIDSIDGSLKVFLDSTACDSEYVYRIEGVTAGGGVSVSNEIQLKAQFSKKTLPLTMNKVSVVDDKIVKLNWERNNHPGHRKYIIDRAGADNIWISAYDSSFVNSYLDSSVKVRSDFFNYRVYAQDYCGNINPISNTGNSILLRGNGDNGNIQLKWNEYVGWAQGYRFALQIKFGENKWADLMRFGSDTINYFDNDLHANMDTPWCYRVIAVQNSSSNDSSFSNIYCDYFGSGVYIPSAFSPNQDGINENFFIGGEVLRRPELDFISEYNLKILDRWGEKLFESSDPNIYWDGRKGGELVPLGQYWFMLYIKDKNGDIINETGPVFVIK